MQILRKLALYNTFCANWTNTITLNANTEEIGTLYQYYGQIRQKTLLEMQILRKLLLNTHVRQKTLVEIQIVRKLLTILFDKLDKTVTLKANTKEIGILHQ